MGVVKSHVEASSQFQQKNCTRAFFWVLIPLVPQLLPQYFKSTEFISGDGGVGTVKKITLGELGDITSMTQRVDVIETEKMIYEYTIIDGDILLGILDTIICHFEVEPADDGGCIVKKTVTYIPKNESDEIPKERVEQSDQVSAFVLKTVEAYLLANPDH